MDSGSKCWPCTFMSFDVSVFADWFSLICLHEENNVDVSVRARRSTGVTDHQCLFRLSERSLVREDGSKITCCGRAAPRRATHNVRSSDRGAFGFWRLVLFRSKLPNRKSCAAIQICQLEPVKNMNEEWPMVSTGNVPLGAEGNWLDRSGNAPSKLLLWPQISRLKADNRSV